MNNKTWEIIVTKILISWWDLREGNGPNPKKKKKVRHNNLTNTQSIILNQNITVFVVLGDQILMIYKRRKWNELN